MKESDFYDFDYFITMENRYYSGAHGQRLRDIISFLPRNKKLLDWGAGSGYLSQQALLKNNDVTAYDFSKNAISFIKSHYPEINAISAIDNSLGRFDVVMLIDIVEHISITTQHDFIMNIKSYLIPKGSIILSTDNIDSCFNKTWIGDKLQAMDKRISAEGKAYVLIKKMEQKQPYHKIYHESHVGLLGRDGVISLMHNSGFKLDKEKHGFLFASPLSTLVSRLFHLLPPHSVYLFSAAT